MRVVFPYIGDFIGGSHISSLILIEGLVRRGCDVKVVLNKRNDQLESMIKNKGISYEYLPSNHINKIFSKKKLFFFIFSELLSFVIYLWKNKIDIIHTNDDRTHLAWAIISKFSKAKHIVHLRNKNLPRNSFWKYHIKSPARYIYLSDFNGKDLKNVNVQKIKIPNPIESARNQKSNEKVFSLPIKIGFIGNLDKRKRFDVFIELAKILNLEFPNKFEFNVFGNTLNEDIASVKNEIKNISFYGFIDDSRFIYSNIDILIATSENEPLGRTVLESMSNNIPVIASKSGAFEELLADGRGLLVEKIDPHLFVQALNETLNNPINLKKQVIKAKEFVDKYYSIDESVLTVLNLYKSIVKNK